MSGSSRIGWKAETTAGRQSRARRMPSCVSRSASRIRASGGKPFRRASACRRRTAFGSASVELKALRQSVV